MKIRILFISLALSLLSFADTPKSDTNEIYRLVETGKCVVDFDAARSVIDFSGCSAAQDSYIGDTTFYASVTCVMEFGTVDEFWELRQESLIAHSKKTYIEVTPRTDFSVRMRGAEIVYAPRNSVRKMTPETFTQKLQEGRFSSCFLSIHPHTKVHKLEKDLRSVRN